jgi:hypothetical protein
VLDADRRHGHRRLRDVGGLGHPDCRGGGVTLGGLFFFGWGYKRQP